MRFAIVGAGGVGGYFGGKLAHAGLDVAFLARGAHLAALRARGLELRGQLESFLVQRVKATADPAAIGPVDAVLVAVKAWQLEALAPRLVPLVGPQTVVVPLLNGVDAPAVLGRAVGPEHVLGGLCNVIAWLGEPGVIHQLGTGASITFGELGGGPSPRAEALRAVLAKAGLEAIVPADFSVALWRKFIFITSFGGLGAVTRAPAGVLRAVPETRELVVRAIAEAAAVGRARGVALLPDAEQKTLAYVETLPPDAFASMARDLFAGKRSELDAWSGAVVRLGREAGVPTPLHDFIYRCLLPTELKARGEGPS